MNTRNAVGPLLRLLCALIAGATFSAPSYALTTSFTFEQLSSFLNGYRYSNDPRKQMLAADLQNKLADSNIVLTPNGFSVSGQETKSTSIGCDYLKTPEPPRVPLWAPSVPAAIGPVSGTVSSSYVANFDGTGTGFGFSAGSGSIGINIFLSGNVSGGVSGTLDWRQGWWEQHASCDASLFGTCIAYNPIGTWGYSCPHLENRELIGASLTGSFKASLALSVDASLEQISSGHYQIVLGRQAKSNLNGPITATSATSANIVLSGDLVAPVQSIVNPLVNLVASVAVPTKVSSALQDKVATKNADIRAQLPVVYDLPSLDPNLYKLMGAALNSPFLHDYIEAHAQEILFYMLINDTQAIKSSFASSAACSAVGGLRSTSGMRALPVYTNAGGACVVADAEGADTGAYFSDSVCATRIDFQPTSLQSWCAEVLSLNSTSLLGNAAAWTANANPAIPGIPSKKWTIAQGTQFPITSEPTSGNTTPFMKRVDYRDVTWKGDPNDPGNYPDVTCQLEMRIYKKDVNATNLIPLLAIHGGSWTYRGAGFTGLEAQISHYTEQGFVVFAPFYRLAGNSDANVECQGAAWSDLTADVEASLTWVQNNGTTFGAKPGKISLMGQSAGAHLAGWLVTHRPSDIERAVLLYPPADLHDFLTHAHPGDTYDAYQPSLDILSTYFGVSPSQLLNDVDMDYVRQNSFADLVANAGGQMPPVFLIHGRADTLIPSNQSVILCNAYGGNAVDNGGGAALRATYNCGSKGRLHLFEEANHALDACVTTRVNGMCLAGSEASRSLVANSLRQARGWLKGDESGWLIPIMSFILAD